MKTNIWLIEYAKGQVSRYYWYGTYGQYSGKNLFLAKQKQYSHMYPPKKWTYESFEEQMHPPTKVHDCVGLIKGALWCDSVNGDPVYNASQDVSADGLINLCSESGSINTLPEIGGLVLWKSGHVGVYLTGGKVCEAKGHAYGVVISDIKDTKWKKWGKIPWIEYVDYTVYVKHLYDTVLARYADAGGLNYWVGELRAKRLTVDDVALEFFASDEFAARELTDSQFVNCLYLTFFNRLPLKGEEDGVKYWMNELKFKARLQVVAMFMSTPEWQENSKYIIKN